MFARTDPSKKFFDNCVGTTGYVKRTGRSLTDFPKQHTSPVHTYC